MSGQDKFISRWSRRKQEARTAEEAPDEADIAETTDAPADEPEKTDEEILTEHGLKDPDEMGPEDDFSAFMNSAIPSRLRNRALRKLWLSDPVLANLDELLEYGEDYTDAATVVENLVTAYKVGKGFINKVAAGDETDIAGSTPEAEAEPEPIQASPADPSESENDDPESAQYTVAAPPPEPEAPPVARQRMAFKF